MLLQLPSHPCELVTHSFISLQAKDVVLYIGSVAGLTVTSVASGSVLAYHVIHAVVMSRIAYINVLTGSFIDLDIPSLTQALV